MIYPTDELYDQYCSGIQSLYLTEIDFNQTSSKFRECPTSENKIKLFEVAEKLVIQKTEAKKLVLALDIVNFLTKYANKDVNDEEYYSSPDAQSFEGYVYWLLGKSSYRPSFLSCWGSGGYSPYTDTQGRITHDTLIERLKDSVEKKNK